MKIEKIILLILLLFSFWDTNIVAQDSLNWKQISKTTFSSEIIWALDHFGNLYVADKDQIKKFDLNGKEMFSQSFKKYGKIASIDARNPMKLLIFSEQQQTVFYLDNTLTKQENDLDLSDFDISYATQVSSSKQADKIWIFDQENSKINLISSNSAQSFRIENTAGILDFSKVNQFFEANDNLWIVDVEKGIFQFDIYGTLVSHFDENAILWLEIDENYMYYLKKNKIIISNLKTDSKRELNLPVSDLKKFKINDKCIYLESGNSIYKYNLEIF